MVGLETPQDLPGGAGRCCLGEGYREYPAQPISLSLLPLQPDPGYAEENGWMDGKMDEWSNSVPKLSLVHTDH